MLNKKVTQYLAFPVLLFVGLWFSLKLFAAEHPKLTLTKSGVAEIRKNLGSVPLFDASLARVKAEVDAEIALGIDTPIPKDFSGGYTHQRHKRNFIIAPKAAALYQILQDEKYAVYVRDMLFQYEAMYKTLPLHPKERSYARGKLFWQCLNDSNWLLFMAQAYDSIYAWLSPKERKQLNQNLFRPFADFISIENPQFYNRIHNHSTWGNAAVGMIGLVMNDDELIERALYGIPDDGLALGVKDDDGGYIKVAGQKSGFLANLEEPFSPDGYYTEGPYYQRYAMYPFLVFSLAMHNAMPEKKVLQHKDAVLLKAVDALINLADADGEFFPLNDAQKGMSYYSSSLVTAVNIAYHYGNQNPQLLSIADKQNQVLLDDAGLAVAKAIQLGKAEPYRKRSINLRDGAEGKQGGVAILRSAEEALTLVFKYSAQGLSHGHYDKLSFSLYNKGDEVLQDYGLVRFVNIEAKGGGNYLKENQTWAKQTIAHNTLVQDQASHFGGLYDEGSQHHSRLHFFDVDNESVQIVSAKESNAYPGTQLQRTMASIKLAGEEKPIVLDLLKVDSNKYHNYDLPFHYLGQIIDTNFDYDVPSSLKTFGKKNGYQHLYVEGVGKPSEDKLRFTWLHEEKFYTLTSVASSSDELFFTRLGANDPDFNLRRDASFVIRRGEVKNTLFANIIEAHGSYSAVSENSIEPESRITALEVVHDDAQHTAVLIESVSKQSNIFIVANKDSSSARKHRLKIDGKYFEWKGPYYFSSL